MPECCQGVEFINEEEILPLDKIRTMPFSRCKYVMFSETDMRSDVSPDVHETGMRVAGPFLRTTEWRTVSMLFTLFPLASEERNRLEEFLLRELTPVTSDDYEPIVPYLAWARALLNLKKNVEREGDDSWLKIAAASICFG